MSEERVVTDNERSFEVAVIRFGLEAQGHMKTIPEMLSRGCSWDEIASKIGWERCSARTHYEARIGCDSTRKIRSTLAEAIEVLRMVHARHKYDMTAEESNRMASVFLHGNNLLETRTFYDFDCAPTRHQ